MFLLELNSYKHAWIVEAINKAVSRVNHVVTDSTKLECRLYKKLGRYVAGNPTRIENRKYIERMIYKEIADSVKSNRYRAERAIHLSGIEVTNEDGQVVEYEPKDDLAVVEGWIELKETITLLAKDDRRRKMILTEWMQGNTNDSDISNTLARVFGGQADSHRKFLRRFRIECRAELTAQAI